MTLGTAHHDTVRRVLVTGASGLLGGALVSTAPPGIHVVAQVRSRRLPPRLASRAEQTRLDLRAADELERCLDRHRPDAVIHAAARTAPQDCEEHPREAWEDNVTATRLVATACASRGLRLLHCSTDLVFDGTAAPYGEDAPCNPVGEYARTKVAAEREASACPCSLVVRIPLLYGASPLGHRSVGEQLIDTIQRGDTPTLFDDEFRTPLHCLQAARLLWELLARGSSGLLHVAGRDRVSRWDLGCAIARRLGLPVERLRRASIREYAGRPPRCPDVSLRAEKMSAITGQSPPTLAEGLRLPLATLADVA